MHLKFSDTQESFRDRARAWLDKNVPRQKRPDSGSAARAYDLAWQQKQYEGGFAGITWPKEYGGQNLSVVEHLIWLEELGRAGAPPLGTLSVALAHAGPTLMALADDAQKQFHLPKILRGEVVWCQGFSEPNSGSDLASIKMQGVVEDDVIVLTGQKVWTSHAQVAEYQELLVRTDPDSQRHAGLTWIICDMQADGVTVRPIETITGSHHYCEVFYDEVRIPITNVVGGIGNGWQTAMSTLSFERGLGTIMAQTALARDVDKLIELVESLTDDSTGMPIARNGWVTNELAELKARIAGTRALTYKAVSQAELQSPGSESSLIGLYFSELSQRVQRFAIDVLRLANAQEGEISDQWNRKYLHSYCETIMGGTSEIRRNIIANRVLGLPRS